MCESLTEQLAAIHAVDLDATGSRALDDGGNHLDRELGHWAAEMDRVKRGPLPALERLLKRCSDTKPQSSLASPWCTGTPNLATSRSPTARSARCSTGR